jgi:hypothetical protein
MVGANEGAHPAPRTTSRDLVSREPIDAAPVPVNGTDS